MTASHNVLPWAHSITRVLEIPNDWNVGISGERPAEAGLIAVERGGDWFVLTALQPWLPQDANDVIAVLEPDEGTVTFVQGTWTLTEVLAAYTLLFLISCDDEECTSFLDWCKANMRKCTH